MRSNSLEVCGNILAVAYQTAKHGMQPAGVELFDRAPSAVSWAARATQSAISRRLTDREFHW